MLASCRISVYILAELLKRLAYLELQYLHYHAAFQQADMFLNLLQENVIFK